jgi:hypothetical protein
MTMVAVPRNRRERRAARQAVTDVAESSRSTASLVAAAINVRVTMGYQNIRWGGTDWQQEAWLHYDTCPEFHSGVNIGAHNLSRSRLIGVDVDPVTGELGTQPSKDPDVADIMNQLFGGSTGQSQALAQLYRHLDVAGDSWVLATDNPDIDGADWEVLATTEVTSAGGNRIMVQQINGMPRPIDTENELLIRIWQPHPKRRWEADSATRSMLPVLRELAALTAMVSATVKSRLASAGILWIPEEITLPPVRSATPNDTTQVKSLSQGAAGWLDLITEAMTAPIRDPDSASAVVPMVSVVKGEHIKNIFHMEFGKDLDAMIEPLRRACVERLAVGMNLPPAILLGLETANHWTAWTITEDFARAYLAPKLELIADAITHYYLRPALRMRGRPPGLFAVNFDLDKLLPNQVTVDNAQKAYTAGTLKETAYMAVLGFSEADIADNAERARRLVFDILARGNPITLEELAPTLALLFPDISVAPAPAVPGAPGAGAAVAAATSMPAARQAPPALTAGPPSTPDQGAAGP